MGTNKFKEMMSAIETMVVREEFTDMVIKHSMMLIFVKEVSRRNIKKLGLDNEEEFEELFAKICMGCTEKFYNDLDKEEELTEILADLEKTLFKKEFDMNIVAV